NPTSGNLDYNENETIYLDFNTSNLQEGTFYKNILINSNDPQKNQVILPIKIVVTKVNRAPYLISNIPTQNLLKDTTHYINLNDYFADPDGDELNYTANSSVENLVNLNLLDNLLFITVLNYGSTNISVNASDGSLNINSAFEVIVENNTGIDNIENNPFVIYPNPSSGIINIKFNSQTSDGYMLEILDLSGKILLERIIYDNEPINIKCLPKGLKIVKLQVDKKLYIDKLLIN
ncbi:MAG: T9SS type A sorting domain-containing protein, partial [Bacteroidales bacterium]|nr:T9SS type A sorting domain-containing protein [Bacteroidales bacterium]